MKFHFSFIFNQNVPYSKFGTLYFIFFLFIPFDYISDNIFDYTLIIFRSQSYTCHRCSSCSMVSDNTAYSWISANSKWAYNGKWYGYVFT